MLDPNAPSTPPRPFDIVGIMFTGAQLVEPPDVDSFPTQIDEADLFKEDGPNQRSLQQKSAAGVDKQCWIYVERASAFREHKGSGPWHNVVGVKADRTTGKCAGRS